MTAESMPDTRSSGSSRPLALTGLWVLLMVPSSLAGTLLQPITGIPYEVFPLVMAGPAVAALICRLVVPKWFPAAPGAASSSRRRRSFAVVAVAGLVFLAASLLLLAHGPVFVPVGWPPLGGAAAVVLGLTLGCVLEEVGYRGVMYRALAARLSPWLAVVVNGVFFGLCHLQYFGAGAGAVALFVASAVLMDVVMVAAWSGSWWHRVLIASGFHAVVNLTLAFVGDPMTTLGSFAALAGAMALAAGIAFLMGHRLGVGELGGQWDRGSIS